MSIYNADGTINNDWFMAPDRWRSSQASKPQRHILFSTSHNFVIIVNPMIFWRTNESTTSFKKIIQILWKDFKLSYKDIQDFTYSTHAQYYGTASEFSANLAIFDTYPKICFVKNPYGLLAEDYLTYKNTSREISPSKEDFLNFIKTRDNLEIYSNSFYTHDNLTNKCLIDFTIRNESIYKDLIQFYSLYHESQLINDYRKRFFNINSFSVLSNNFKVLYTQETLKYLEPYFKLDFINYNYHLEL